MLSALMIADLHIVGPFRVFDIHSGNYVYSYLEQSAPGDIPPDIGILPVVGLRTCGAVLYIDTEVL